MSEPHTLRGLMGLAAEPAPLSRSTLLMIDLQNKLHRAQRVQPGLRADRGRRGHRDPRPAGRRRCRPPAQVHAAALAGLSDLPGLVVRDHTAVPD